MPKGSKSVGALCGELGMDAVAENYFRKDSQSYVKENIADVPNATDEVIEELALTFLNDGAGEKYFSFDAALVSYLLFANCSQWYRQADQNLRITNGRLASTA